MTPETETTTHYFYGMAHRYLHDEQWITDFWMSAVVHAFEDDRLMIEAVQRNMGSATDIVALRPHINKSDQTALMARRHLASLISAEKAGISCKRSSHGEAAPAPTNAYHSHAPTRSEEHTSVLQSLQSISSTILCFTQKEVNVYKSL